MFACRLPPSLICTFYVKPATGRGTAVSLHHAANTCALCSCNPSRSIAVLRWNAIGAVFRSRNSMLWRSLAFTYTLAFSLTLRRFTSSSVL